MIRTKGTVALVSVSWLQGRKLDRPPVALICLGSALRVAGYRPKLFIVPDASAIALTAQRIAEMPNLLLVGLSVHLGPTALISLRLAESVRRLRDVPVVAGGKFPSAAPELFLREQSVDAVGVGEGEAIIVDLVRRAEAGQPIVGQFVEHAPAQNLDDLKYDLDLYSSWSQCAATVDGKRTMHDCLETQRGCRYRCRFCYRSNQHAGVPSGVRSHSVDWVIEKVKELKRRTGIESVTFCDDEFWQNEERTFELLERLAEIGVPMRRLRMCYTSLRDAQMARRLYKLGVRKVTLGLESGSDRMLKLMGKGVTTSLVEEKVRMLTEVPGLRVSTSVISGCPTETRMEFLRTFQFLMHLGRIDPDLYGSANFYWPFPGTDFYYMAVERGFVPPVDVRGWAAVDAASVHRVAQAWLPWFDLEQQRLYRRAVKYLTLYRTAREILRGRTRSTAVRLIAKVAEFCARRRLSYWVLRMPFEQALFNAAQRLRRS